MYIVFICISALDSIILCIKVHFIYNTIYIIFLIFSQVTSLHKRPSPAVDTTVSISRSDEVSRTDFADVYILR